MNIHEYQAKKLMSTFGVKTLRGSVAKTEAEALQVAKNLGGNVWVVKAQIHAGGRGKAGGVKLARSLEEVSKFSNEILGKNLVTVQTGPQGKVVHQVLIEEGCSIKKEYYLGMILNRTTGHLLFMASSEGGVEIEEVAHKNPEKIIKVELHPAAGYSAFVGRKLAYSLGLKDELVSQFEQLTSSLYRMYTQKDCTSIEINPLVLTTEGQLLVLDAKISFDDNALFRHSEVEELRDETEESAAELEAKKYSLSYISLDGNIGCLVNGAGLAMATMDIIKLHGGSPANFLDVGGGATKEQVEKAFTLILKDHSVKAILVNIFGGIMKCDIIAEGVIAAARSLDLKVPLVVRLEGTHVSLAKKILADSGLKMTVAEDLTDAAKKVVALSKGK